MSSDRLGRTQVVYNGATGIAPTRHGAWKEGKT
jgi:hypothetical protein